MPPTKTSASLESYVVTTYFTPGAKQPVRTVVRKAKKSTGAMLVMGQPYPKSLQAKIVARLRAAAVAHHQ